MATRPSNEQTGKSVFAYYCSGHGFGHATRVTATALQLISRGHTVHVVTNAPAYVFLSITIHPSGRGTYRNADVDAGVIQPKAYDIDRQATLERLTSFMKARETTLQRESEWLRTQHVDCVLVDATFLPCAAAEAAGIPSVIISNFTFCSVYSYLSAPAPISLLVAATASDPDGFLDGAGPEAPSPPLQDSEIRPFVQRAIADYGAADLLLRLPGAIPIPAFDTDVQLPSPDWVDREKHSFTPKILSLLSRDPSSIPCNPAGSRRRKRRVVDVPLVVRSTSDGAYTDHARDTLLASMGVPRRLRGIDTKVLLVSFGGQSIPRPRSRPPSPVAREKACFRRSPSPEQSFSSYNSSLDIGPPSSPTVPFTTPLSRQPSLSVPGSSETHRLLPPGWIAIVCGLSGPTNAIRADLPEHFYASDQDVYVPDLTAISDVVLGKLGYGTCSETLSTRTPLLYVPRPLFVEEFGLKQLMMSRGTALSIPRHDFESGLWSKHVLEAFHKGSQIKSQFREQQLSNQFRDENAAAVICEHLEVFLEGVKAEME